MKRSVLSLVAACAIFAFSASTASAHYVTVASGKLDCAGVTAAWTSFPGGPFDLTAAFADQAGGKAVASPYVVAHLTGASGTVLIKAPAASGVDFRKVLITWSVDGGGSVTAWVKCGTPPPPPPPPPPTTVTVTVPGQTVTVPGQTVTVTKTVTTPGNTTTVTTPGSTTPGQTVTVTTPGVTTPGQIVTVTTPGPTVTVTVPGPTVTTTVPGPTKTVVIVKHPKPRIIYRRGRIVVICPKGYSGSYSIGMGKKHQVTARCSAGQRVKGVGVTG